jgi:chromosome segregation ATPase
MNRKVGRTTQQSRPAQGTPLQQVFQVAQFHEQRLNRLEANTNNSQTSSNVDAKIELIQGSLQSLSETVNKITLNLNASNENMDKVANGLNSNNKTLMGSEAAIAVLQERISLLETEISKLKEENKHTIHTGGKISLTIDETHEDEDDDDDDDDDEEGEEEGQ